MLTSAECRGEAHYFLPHANDYANERVVFGLPIDAPFGEKANAAKLPAS